MPTEPVMTEPGADALEEVTLAETLDFLKSRLAAGIKVTPVCLAVIGWLCETPTDPAIAEIRRTDEGRVWLRLSDETRMEPLCSFLDFLSQVRIIGHSLKLSEPQTQHLIAWTRQRLG